MKAQLSRVAERRARRADDADGGADVSVSAPNRVLEIQFAKPLERFRTLKVDLLEGILGTDGQPLKPWTLTFALGGA